MAYTVKNRMGATLLNDGTEMDALATVKNHPAPDVLNVFVDGKKMSGDELILRTDN